MNQKKYIKIQKADYLCTLNQQQWYINQVSGSMQVGF